MFDVCRYKEPIYKKSDFLMAFKELSYKIQFSWYIAKKLDKGFHKNKGQWDRGRKFLFKASDEIVQKPDNKSVFEIAEKHPEFFCSWIFLNPSINEWEKEFLMWQSHSKSIGIKLHPFWHRYSLEKAVNVAKFSEKYNLPIMIHLGFDKIDNVRDFLSCCKENTIIFSHAGFPFYKWIWPLIKKHKNCYVDFSSHHVSKKIIEDCVDALGPDRCLYGTDDPYGDDKAGIIIKNWIENLNINDKEKRLILSQNSKKILKKII